ncbi:MAG: hypothetical protein WC517_02750 [Patescibacteria group bacterium]
MGDYKPEDYHYAEKTGMECALCSKLATHKISEEISPNDPFSNRHPWSSWVCCEHFRRIFGRAVFCPKPLDSVNEGE